jgi:hypothetical protein
VKDFPKFWEGIPIDEKLKYALILAFVLNSTLVLSGFYENAFDSYTHIFFADHYRRTWFDTWEPKWYGGFSVTSYPPLSHQVIALLSFVTGLEWAYQILTLCLTIIFPFAVYKFSEVFVSSRAAGYASLISVFLPSVAVTTYNFGQFPTLFSLVATLFTIRYLHDYLRNGTKFDLALASCLFGVAVGTHHFTAIFFLPTLTLIMLITSFCRGLSLSKLLARIALFAVLGIGISLLVLYPFLLFSINIEMQPIPHISRINLFSDLFAFSWFFLSMYGPTLLLIPSVACHTYRNKRNLPLFAVAILLFLLGLGGTTFLPELLFGNMWMIFTYERFAFWASIVFLPLFGVFFSSRYKKKQIARNRETLLIIFLATLAISAIYFGSNPVLQPTNVDLEPLQEFLSNSENSNWRYITLGFGDAKMQKLSILTNATTVDGYYFLARTIPILKDSGISTLDSAKFFENGIDILEQVLREAEDYKLKWVFCNDPYYYDSLSESGFVLLFSQDSANDGRLHGVTIWMKENISPLEDNGEDVENSLSKSIIDVTWGTVPLSILIASFIFFETTSGLMKTQVFNVVVNIRKKWRRNSE